jgi:GR25 family glycosyltransferase involved in LPS biosynthesis
VLEKFDRIFVINLPSRKDRYKEMGRELEKIGLSWESPKVIHFPAIRPDSAGDFPSVGARGCFLSHFEILKTARDAQYRSILILEDDCDLFADNSLILNNILSGFSSLDWGIIHGGNAARVHASFPSPVRLGQQDKIQLTHFMAISGWILSDLADYFAAMLARPAGSPLGGPMHVDGAYTWYHQARPEVPVYSFNPPIAFQRSSRTDIGDLRWFDRMPGFRQVVSLVRSMRN